MAYLLLRLRRWPAFCRSSSRESQFRNWFLHNSMEGILMFLQRELGRESGCGVDAQRITTFQVIDVNSLVLLSFQRRRKPVTSPRAEPVTTYICRMPIDLLKSLQTIFVEAIQLTGVQGLQEKLKGRLVEMEDFGEIRRVVFQFVFSKIWTGISKELGGCEAIRPQRTFLGPSVVLLHKKLLECKDFRHKICHIRNCAKNC
jgi:hypothetical protein